MYQGYLAIGGEDGVGTTELVNAMRTYTYARNLVPSMPLLLPPEYEAPDLPVLLGHEYDSPLADMAPWVDPDDSSSAEFLGLYPTELSGFADSTWETEATEFVRDGGVAGNGRNAGREMRVKGVMVALSEDGMDAGFTWLRNVLSDAACREVDADCGGESLIVLSGPPQVCPEEAGEVIPGEVHPCLVPFVRQYYRVQCTQGVRILRQWVSECGPMAEVEFLLYAGVPQPHRLPEFIGLAQSEPLETFTNLITNPSFEDGTDTATGSTNAILSRSDAWSAAGDYSLRMQAGREPDRIRHNYVLNPSFETDLSNWSQADADTTWDDSRVDTDAFSGTHSLQADITGAGEAIGWNAEMAPVEGRNFAAVAYVKVGNVDPSVDRLFAQTLVLDESGTAVATRVVVTPLTPGGWNRIALTMTAQEAVTAASLTLAFRLQAGETTVPFAPGDSLLLDAVLVEGATLAGTYFDGDTPDSPGITYAWETDGSSSATYQGVVTSTRVYADITDGMPLPFDVSPGVEYRFSATVHLDEAATQVRPNDALTLQAVWQTPNGSDLVVRSAPAPNAPGDHRVVLDFVVPDDIVGGTLRLYGGTGVDTYWDALMLSEGEPPHYFDGDTPDEDGWVYQWLGAANASASLAEYNPIPPETIPDVVCDPDEVLVVLRRNLNTNPGPGNPQGWKPWSKYGAFSRSFVPDDTLRPGGSSARVVRQSGNKSIYMAYIDRVGYLDHAPSSRPRATPGRRYTASVWVKADRNGKARMRAIAYDGASNQIKEWRSAIPNLSANTWTRLSITFVAPNRTISIGVHAWTYINSSTIAPTGAVSWFSEALLERSSEVGTYFDGNFTDTAEHDYRWEGVPNASPSVIVHAESGDLLVDPDCPFVPDPPKPPVVVTDCIETPSEWTRYTVLVTHENVPLWGSMVPVVTINTGASAARQVRIRFYPLPDPQNPLTYEECSYDGEFILTYLPPSTTLTIDAIRREAMASVGDSDPVSALNLLTGTGGMPYTWTVLNCDRNYAMTVDVAPVAEDVTVSLSLVGRE